MTDPNRDHPEIKADAQQAQAVLDELDRILIDIPLRPGLSWIKNHSAPGKTRWHQGFLFIRSPEGQQNVDNPNSINLGSVSNDKPDGSRTSFTVELNSAEGLQVTKHTFLPSDQEPTTILDGINVDPLRLLLGSKSDLARATGEHEARTIERSLGLHVADYGEVSQLLEELRVLDPAPAEDF